MGGNYLANAVATRIAGAVAGLSELRAEVRIVLVSMK